MQGGIFSCLKLAGFIEFYNFLYNNFRNLYCFIYFIANVKLSTIFYKIMQSLKRHEKKKFA